VDVAFDDQNSTADAGDLDNFSTKTVSFAASDTSGATESVTVPITDDAETEGNETARFGLTNLNTTGNASIGDPDSTALTIIGDDRTVADARSNVESGTQAEVILEGTVSRAYGSYARFQDESGPTGASAVVVRQTDGPLSSAFQEDILDGSIQPGTQLRVRGMLSAPDGQVRFNNADVVRYVVQDQGGPPASQQVSLEDLAGSGEAYESELVEVKSITFPNVTSDSSFAAETSYTVSDGKRTFTFRVGGEEESALVGDPIPTGVFSFSDVVGQSSDEGNGTYELAGIRSASALPVEIAELDAEQTGGSVELTWTTASEANNAGFRVQYQGRTGWTTLGFVESKAAGGTTTKPQSYRYAVDRELPPGTHQFRLQQEDLDGSTALSDVVTLDVTMDEPLRLSAPAPSPASGQVTVSFGVKEATETSLVLFNVLGQRVKTLYEGRPEAEQSRTLDFGVETLPSGVYFLRLQASGRTQTERLTVLR
jgi:hypothetical protein